MPRPRKNAVAESVAVDELNIKVSELESELLKKSAEVQALSSLQTVSATPTMVTVGNFSGTFVGIPYEYNGQRRVLTLDIVGMHQTGALPLEVWIELERSSKLVSEGYIARMDRPFSNPNIIPDIPEFVRTIREKDIKARLDKITNRHVLTRVLNYLESIDSDKASGKIVYMKQLVMDRYTALTNIRIVSEDTV